MHMALHEAIHGSSEAALVRSNSAEHGPSRKTTFFPRGTGHLAVVNDGSTCQADY